MTEPEKVVVGHSFILAMSWYSQSLPVSVNEGLEEGLVVGDGLQDVPVVGDVANGPLAQSCAALSEDVAKMRDGKQGGQTNQTLKQ